MPEHIQYEDDDLFNPETHHEHSDVPVRPLMMFIVIFIVFSAVTYFVVLGFYKMLVSAERKRMDPPQTQVTRPGDASVPQNQPLLQPFPREVAKGQIAPPNRSTPVTDLHDMRRAEDAVLKHYGWIDKQQGVVHIPIEDAKKLFAARAAVQGQVSGGATAGAQTSGAVGASVTDGATTDPAATSTPLRAGSAVSAPQATPPAPPPGGAQ
jgi:hypothetical protein